MAHSLVEQSSAVWTEWRSDAVFVVDRKEELPAAEAAVDLYAAAKCRWVYSQVVECPSKTAEAASNICRWSILLEAEWLSCPGTRWSGLGAER